MNQNAKIRSAQNLIEQSQKILCLTREKANPEGLISLLALQQWLESKGKRVISVVPNDLDPKWQFLAGKESLQKRIPESKNLTLCVDTQQTEIEHLKYTQHTDQLEIILTPKDGATITPEMIHFQPVVEKFDLIIVLDSPNLESLGRAFIDHPELFAQNPILNISTDLENEFFGTLPLVEMQKSTTTEILCDLVDLKKNPIEPNLANLLLTGLICGTGSFLEPNTTPSALEYASLLQEKGADQSDIIENLFKKKSIPTLKIWGRILLALEVDPLHRIGWASLHPADLEIAKASTQDIDQIADQLLRFTHGTDLVALLFESESETQIQLRINHPSIDPHCLQKTFGGEIVPNGLDIKITDRTVSEIEGHFLETLIKLQCERLKIEDQTLQKLRLNAMRNQNQTHHTQKIETNPPNLSPKAPEVIPFRAPLQPHEKTGKIGDHIHDESEKKNTSPKKSGIPKAE
jgi:nanoRNase/pAp phosphatase (c-di-AMP/oligoRNAs hydrolase)